MNRELLDVRLTELERSARAVLADAGFPTEADALTGMDAPTWNRWNALMREAHKPSDTGPTVKRAILVLLNARDIRRYLAEGNAEAAVWTAMDLAYQDVMKDIHYQQVIAPAGRRKAARQTNQERQRTHDENRTQVLRLYLAHHKANPRLTKNAAARLIAAEEGMSEGTVRNYLKMHTTRRR